jgi:PIN domain nuclease of toxin-antitoxin system
MPNLLDTHSFIWFINGDNQLSEPARLAIENGVNYISIASLWEIAIKLSLGKLELESAYSSVIDQITQNGFQILPLTFDDTLSVSTMELHHRDPFDRMLIAQGINNNLHIITKDRNFSLYRVDTIW